MAAYPSSSFAKYSYSSHQPVLRSDSVSGKESSRKVAGHLARINVSHPTMLAGDYGIVDGFLCDKDYVSFTVVLPDKEPEGVATGTPLVDASHSKDDSMVMTDGWTAGTTGILKAGDILVFSGNDTHVYTNLTDVSSNPDDNFTKADGTGVLLKADGTGSLLMSRANQAELSISPDLKEDLSDNTSLTVASVPYTVKLDKPHESSTAPPILYNFNFNVTEVF